MTIKEFLRSVVFLVLVAAMVFLLCDLFEQENTSHFDQRFTTYKSLPEDSVDAVFLGTSGVDRYWISSKGYEEYGMTVYALSVNSFPSWLYTYIIEEAYAYQSPELVIVDVRSFTQDCVNVEAEAMEVRSRRVLDTMDFLSVNRVKAAFKTMEVIHQAHPDQPTFDLSYLLSIIKYHSKWAEDDYLIQNNFGGKEHLYAGFYMREDLSLLRAPQPVMEYDPTYKLDLDPIAEQSLYELLDYVEEKDINILFVDTPQLKDNIDMGRSNVVYEILEERGYDVLSYFTDETWNSFLIEELDPATDFYNGSHVNYYGAEKFTDHFAAWLNERYDFPDHRDDPVIDAEWGTKYEDIVARIAEWEENKKK